MELCVGSCDCSKSVTSYKIGEAHFRLMGTTGFHAAKTKNERDGLVVRALASHHGFDSQIRRQMWVEFVGSLLCTESFSPGTLVSPLLKNQNLT